MAGNADVLVSPKISKEETAILVEKLFGLDCLEIIQLNGYDDKNFKILVKNNCVKNEHIQEVQRYGYVLKITNTLDSKNLPFMEACNGLMLHLDSKGIKCPKPVKSKNGEYYSIEELESGKHVVRLLEYVPGKILMDVPLSKKLFYEFGNFAARVDKALETFNHLAYQKHSSIWMLDSVPQIRKYTHAIDDNERRNLVEYIIDRFELQVLSKTSQLERGLIHGDFNEQNIIVNKDRDDAWSVSSVLDFGDSSMSYYLFELAIAMTYMIILDKSLDSGGYVLAGYRDVKHVKDNEMQLLKLCIAARMCQSLVMGAYTSKKDPGNNYVLVTQANGWKMLYELWQEPNEQLIERWTQIYKNYSLR